MAFVDTELRPAGEVQQKVGRIKLSEAIRRGCEMSRPSKEYATPIWIMQSKGKCFACVLGAAWLGTGGGDEFYSAYWGELSKKTGSNFDVLDEAQARYEHQGQSREQVADWLEAQGF